MRKSPVRLLPRSAADGARVGAGTPGPSRLPGTFRGAWRSGALGRRGARRTGGTLAGAPVTGAALRGGPARRRLGRCMKCLIYRICTERSLWYFCCLAEEAIVWIPSTASPHSSNRSPQGTAGLPTGHRVSPKPPAGSPGRWSSPDTPIPMKTVTWRSDREHCPASVRPGSIGPRPCARR
jgi:hypothetical protein